MTDKITTDKELQIIEKKTSPIVKKSQSYEIKSQENVDEASAFMRELQLAERTIESKRLSFTAPLNLSLKNINESFRQIKTPIVEARAILGNKILTWRRIEQERIARDEEKRRKIQEAHARAGHEVNAPVILERPDNKIGNAQVSKVTKWRVVDQTKIPEEYKVVNPVLVNIGLKAGKTIPGIELYQEEVLSTVGRG